jgi:hypothetical protein
MTERETTKLTPFAGKDLKPHTENERPKTSAKYLLQSGSLNHRAVIYDTSRTGMHLSGTGKNPTVAERR